MSIKDFSTEELKVELALRNKPVPRVIINPDTLVKKCNEYLDCVAVGKNYDTHHIFEAAMTAIYGPLVWDWINEHEE